MTQKENDNEQISNDNFMKSVYNKVSNLRTILQENQPEMNFTRSNFIQGIKNKNSLENSKELIEESSIKFVKPQTSVNRIKINEQSKVNRQQQIINQRVQHLSASERKMAKTCSSFSNFNYIQSLKNSNSVYKQSLGPIQYQQTKKFSFTAQNFNRNKINESKSSNNLFIISTQHVKSKIQKSKEQKNQSKCQLNHIQIKDRKENKMARILGFLDKNRDHSKKQVLQQKLKKMNEMKEMTTNRLRTRSEIRSSLNGKMNEKNQRQILKDQQFELQVDEQFEFKPIGSASTLRRLATNQQEKVKNQDQNVLSLVKLKTLEDKEIQIVQSKASNTNNIKESSNKKTYLAKGNRVREILYKKLSNKQSSKGQDMVYVREYDQWVPSEFVSNNRKQLETYLQILMGKKKEHKFTKLTLNEAQVIYF